MFEPKPAHAPWPPLHIGGDGPAALRRAAVVGDGWIPMNHTAEQIPAAAARMAQLLAEPASPVVRRSPWGLGTPAPTVSDDFADLGISRAFVKPWERGRDALEGIRRFAEQVLPEVAEHPVAPPVG